MQQNIRRDHYPSPPLQTFNALGFIGFAHVTKRAGTLCGHTQSWQPPMAGTWARRETNLPHAKPTSRAYCAPNSPYQRDGKGYLAQKSMRALSLTGPMPPDVASTCYLPAGRWAESIPGLLYVKEASLCQAGGKNETRLTFLWAGTVRHAAQVPKRDAGGDTESTGEQRAL